MFNMHDFVMKTLRGMRKTEPEYKVRQYALSWFEKDVLTAEDLAEVDSWYPTAESGEGEDEDTDEEGAVVEP